MSEKATDGFHLARFGTAADQQFLLGDFLNTYDELIVNANIVAHMKTALAAFLVVKAKNKPYFIDPQTHAFQHNIDYIKSEKTGEIKRSIKKLAEAFGEPVTSCVLEGGRSLSPQDFKNDLVTANYCKNVLEFQEHYISEEANKSDASKYIKFVNKEKGLKPKKLFLPTRLIAPYFFLEDTEEFDDWLQVNMKCAAASKKTADRMNASLGLQIVISRDLLHNKAKMRKLLNGYNAEHKEAVLLWIDGFSESKVSEKDLLAYIDLLKGLSEHSKIINLYGGFFSIILNKCKIIPNLRGVAHCLEYGESRSVVPVGGGLPTAKFYFPALHSRLLFRDALRAVRAVGGDKNKDAFHQNVCDCKMCKRVITSNPKQEFEAYGRTRPISYKRNGQSVTTEFPLTETKEKTVAHYMWAKNGEYNQQYSLAKVIAALKDIVSQCENSVMSDSIDYCNVWANVLEKSKP